MGDWHDTKLSQLQEVIEDAVPAIRREMKWTKPSRPSGVPTWSHQGIVCIGEPLKNAVRLTFPKGALITSSKELFNARLDSNSVRAIDFHEADAIDTAALTALVQEAARLNEAKVRR